jgi:hypothetical protein
MIEPSSASSSLKAVSIRQATSGARDRTSRQTDTRSPSGSWTSSTATPGRSAGILASAEAAVLAFTSTEVVYGVADPGVTGLP